MEQKNVLKKIILDDFKGVRHGEYAVGDEITVIGGRNGSGKSTIFDAHTWLWIDRDSSLKSNPNIRPDDGRECTPTVTEVWEMSGVEVTVCKMQKMKKSKPDANGIVKTALTNTYSINSVPKTQRDFTADMEAKGMELSHFAVLSHAEVFLGQKDSDMRNSLFEMATEMTDAEIANQTAGCEKTAELLKSYRLDEISAMQKATKKKADEQMKKIPGVIEGLEMSKVDDNSAELNKTAKVIYAEITDLENKMNEQSPIAVELSKVGAERVNTSDEAAVRKGEVEEAWRKKNAEINRGYEDAVTKAHEASTALLTAERDLGALMDKQRFAADRVKSLVDKYKAFKKSYAPQSDELEAMKNRTAPDDIKTCPTCGRAYPESKIKELVAKFNADNKAAFEKASADYKQKLEVYKKQLDELTAEGKAAQAERDGCAEKIAEAEKAVEAARSEKEKRDAEMEKAKEAVSKIGSPSDDLARDKKYWSLAEKVATLKSKESELSLALIEDGKQKREMRNTVNNKRMELEEIQKAIAKIDNNVRIDAQISAQKDLLRNFAQAKADAEEILDQLDMVSRRKNELLAESINKHFKVVRWKLFDYLKNGEYKEVCIPEVYDTAHEEWRAIGTTANTALEILGKLDIVSGFQNFYGEALPVFLDGAERLDTESMKKVDMPCQMIFLRVTDGELAVRQA